MGEAVTGQPLRSGLHFVAGPDQAVAVLQLPGEALQDLSLALALDRGYHLGGELLPFDTCHTQRAAQFRVQTTEPRFDDTLQPDRQRFPRHGPLLHPFPVWIFDQDMAILQILQQL